MQGKRVGEAGRAGWPSSDSVEPPAMFGLVYLKAALVVAPILFLFGLGLSLTLRSGAVGLDGGKGRWRFVGNLSQTVFVLGVCVLILVAIQQIIGFRLSLNW
jgi:hypothetical protein